MTVSISDLESQQLAEHTPLVKRVVRQLLSQAGGILDREDMEQIGLMALLEALRRFGTLDENFAGYAVLRIRGAILDELRRLDWRPRSVRQDAHRMRDALRELTRKLGREPSEAEALQEIGISSAAYHEMQVAESAETLASFDELLAGGVDLPDDMTPEKIVVRQLTLAKALDTLDEREQRVIQLYYEYELSLKEIAEVLDLTEARVCQLNKAALNKMRLCLSSM